MLRGQAIDPPAEGAPPNSKQPATKPPRTCFHTHIHAYAYTHIDTHTHTHIHLTPTPTRARPAASTALRLLLPHHLHVVLADANVAPRRYPQPHEWALRHQGGVLAAVERPGVRRSVGARREGQVDVGACAAGERRGGDCRRRRAEPRPAGLLGSKTERGPGCLSWLGSTWAGLYLPLQCVGAGA